jgi:hypothetical protein
LFVFIAPALLGVGEDGHGRASIRSSTGQMTDVTTQTTWQSANPSIATITADGVVRAVGRGTVAITGRYQGVTSAPFGLVVITGEDIEKILLPGSPWMMNVGQPAALVPRLVMFSTALSSTIYDLDPPGRATYASSDPTVAPIDASGIVTTAKPGTATLTATYLGKSESVRVVLGTQDHDDFKLTGAGTQGRLGIDSRVTYSSTFGYWLVSAPSGVMTHHITDQNGRELGSLPTAIATSGGPKTVDFQEQLLVPAGTTRVCTSATLDLSTGTRLNAVGFCDTAR